MATQETVSSDQNERITERRIRIQRRIEGFGSKKSSTSTFTSASSSSIADLQKYDLKQKTSFSQQQVESSMMILDKLIRDGVQLTTNVERAIDARELEWRTKEKAIRLGRTAKLELEASVGKGRFVELQRGWEKIFKHNLPHTLHQKLMEQKKACIKLVEEKNILIEHLKQELYEKENSFDENFRMQADDTKIIIDRMNEHVSLMKAAYKEELEAMELAFMEERRDILQKHQEKWSETLSEMTEREEIYVETRKKLINQCQEELDRQWKEDSKEYSVLKCKMESDIMHLELEFRTLKTKVMLNQEKLEYNYHTLKKRDEENSVMKSNQKRRLTKMNDIMANLKRKLRQLEKQCSVETQKLRGDYKKVVNLLLTLEKKYTLFQKVDIGRYRDMWKMNESEMKEMVLRLVDLDKIIHQQYLQIPWTPINLTFLENNGPWGKHALNPTTLTSSKEPGDLPTTSNTAGLLSDALKKFQTEDADKSFKTSDAFSMPVRDPTPSVISFIHPHFQTSTMPRQSETHSLQERDKQFSTTSFLYPQSKSGKKLQPSDYIFSQAVLRKITTLLCDHSGFLVEDRILRLTNKLPKTANKLVKVNAILDALNIYSEEEMNLLAYYFARYAISEEYKPYSATEEGPQRRPQEIPIPESTGKHTLHDTAKTSTFSLSSRKSSVVSRRLTKKESLTIRSSSIFPEQLSPCNVMKAIREFVAEHRNVSTVIPKVPSIFCQQLIRNKETDGMYWNLYRQVFPPEHVLLWKALSPAIEKYHNILRQREKLRTEVNCLRVQNVELTKILDRYIKAKINKELKLPPIPVQMLMQREQSAENCNIPSCSFLPPLINLLEINEKPLGHQYLNL